MTAAESSQAARYRTDRYPTRCADVAVFIDRAEPTVWARTDTPGPHTPAQLSEHARDGFSTVPALITPTEVRDLADELTRLSSDPALIHDDRVITEARTRQPRSVFAAHQVSPMIAALAEDERLAGRARQILGSQVYIHQSRVNYKPGFGGGGFYWHSDFETWHAEDGMPAPRAVSVSISLTDNHPHNGCLMIMPGSHRTFVSCLGRTPAQHHRQSLRQQQIGTPDPRSLTQLADAHGITQLTGPAGTGVFFDSNCMHGSADNITPYPRSNIFIVYNSVHNTLVDPFAAPMHRPEHLATQTPTPVGLTASSSTWAGVQR